MDYQVPQQGELLPITVQATMDGTSAATAYYAAVQVIAPSGRVMTNAISTPIAAGASAAVSWFRGVASVPSSSAVLPGTAVDRSVTSQVIGSATTTPISFDSVLFDDLGWFNPANPTEITVGLAGQYFVLYTFAWVYPALSNFPIQTTIDLNVLTRVLVSEQVNAVQNTPNATSGAAIVNAAAGDVFRLLGYQASGGNMSTWIAGSRPPDVQAFPTLSVIRIGDRA